MNLPQFPPQLSPRCRPGSSVVIALTTLLSFNTLALAQDWSSLEKTSPAELYGEKCGMCHRAGGMGTGILGRRLAAEQALLENRRDLQPQFIEIAVRAGIGVMFPLSRAELSDAQLQTISDYLTRSDREQ